MKKKRAVIIAVLTLGAIMLCLSLTACHKYELSAADKFEGVYERSTSWYRLNIFRDSQEYQPDTFYDSSVVSLEENGYWSESYYEQLEFVEFEFDKNAVSCINGIVEGLGTTVKHSKKGIKFGGEYIKYDEDHNGFTYEDGLSYKSKYINEEKDCIYTDIFYDRDALGAKEENDFKCMELSYCGFFTATNGENYRYQISIRYIYI